MCVRLPSPVPMAAKPQKKPNGYAATSHPSPPSPPSPPRRHSRGIHGNPVLSYVRLPSPVPMAARPQKKPNGYAATFSPSVILAPLFLFPSFSGPARESSPSVGKTKTGFPPSARMTAGKGRVIPGVVRVFFFRHSRGIHGNPVLSCVRLPSPVTMAARPQKNLTATPQFPVLSSFSGPARESSPSVGKTRTGFPPLARMTAGKGRVIPGVVRVFFFRHSRGIHGNPVLSCVRLPSPVTMAARPQKNLTATPQCPVLSSSSRPARESSS